MSKLEKITFTFTIDGKEYGQEFTVNKEASKTDAESIGIVIQKWLTLSLEKFLTVDN